MGFPDNRLTRLMTPTIQCRSTGPCKQGSGTMGHRSLAFLLIFVGGGFGSMMRSGVNLAGAALFGVNFPYGTMIVNITGSFTIGIIAGWFALRGHGGQMMSLFLTTGILGGFTTFSAFSLDAALLWERNQTGGAI